MEQTPNTFIDVREAVTLLYLSPQEAAVGSSTYISLRDVCPPSNNSGGRQAGKQAYSTKCSIVNTNQSIDLIP